MPLKLVWEVLCDSDGTRGAVLGAKKLDCLEQKVINPCGSQSDLGLVDVGALGCVALAESEDELVGAELLLVGQQLDDESLAVLDACLLQSFGRVSVDLTEEAALVSLAQS